MRMLDGLRQYGARQHREILALPGEMAILPHPRDGTQRLVPHVFRQVGVAEKAAELRPGRGPPGAKLEAAIADDIEGSGAFSAAHRVIKGGQDHHHAMAEANML